MRQASKTRDPRAWATALAGAFPMGVGVAASGAPRLEVALAALAGGLVMGAIGWFALPEWKDPRHSVAAGAFVILAAGLVATCVVWALA